MASDVTIGSIPTLTVPATSAAQGASGGAGVPASQSGSRAPQSPTPAPTVPPADSSSSSDRKAATASDSAAFSLQFDNDTQQFFLEARDPVTGAVLVQVPSQYAAKEFQSAEHKAPRGSKLNSSI